VPATSPGHGYEPAAGSLPFAVACEAVAVREICSAIQQFAGTTAGMPALMAPRPFLVSGGAPDRPVHWIALNRTIEVNKLLGRENRVAMTMRDGHSPTVESNAQVYAFLEHFLKEKRD
jgi:hypothetical protein